MRGGVNLKRRENGYKWIGTKMGWGELETKKEWQVIYMFHEMG